MRAVILSSAIPGRFCAGLDLPAFLRGTPADAHRVVGKIYVRISEAQSALGKPSIAAIGGAARGAGMSIAITCDMILAADHASFGYPEVDVGLLPAIHFHHLPRIVGRHRAFDLLFSGRSFDVAEAVSLGLVSRHVPAAELMLEARRTAASFAAKSPALMRLGKAAFLRAAAAGYHEGQRPPWTWSPPSSGPRIAGKACRPSPRSGSPAGPGASGDDDASPRAAPSTGSACSTCPASWPGRWPGRCWPISVPT